MKATLLLTEGKPTSVEVSDVNKMLLQGIVTSVFLNYTEDEFLFLWRELKSLAIIGLHDGHSRLMLTFAKLSELFTKMVGETFEYDSFAIKFDCGGKIYLLSAGSGVKAFGFESSEVEWDWSEGELGCMEPVLPDGIERYNIE